MNGGWNRACRLLFVFSVGLLAGCATIIKGGGQNVTLRTQPTDADIRIVEARSGRVVATGKSPFSVELLRSSGYFKGGKYTVVVEKEGYTSKEITIDSSANGWYLFGNLVFGGLIGWIIVDPATGGMWSLDPQDSTIELSPLPPGAPSVSSTASIMVATLDDLPPEVLPALRRIDGNQ